MKKLLAFIVALALIASLFIVPAGAAGIVDCDSAGLVAGYLDDIRWGAWAHSYIGTAVGAGVPGGGESLHSWWNGLGADGLVRSAYTFNQGFDELIIRGWIGFDQPIVAMGYQYNDEAPVIDTYRRRSICPQIPGLDTAGSCRSVHGARCRSAAGRHGRQT